jgi:hypothetical protein
MEAMKNGYHLTRTVKGVTTKVPKDKIKAALVKSENKNRGDNFMKMVENAMKKFVDKAKRSSILGSVSPEVKNR